MRKTFKYIGKKMTETNSAKYFIEICKNYKDYCNVIQHAAKRIYEAEPILTGIYSHKMEKRIPSRKQNKNWHFKEEVWNDVRLCESEMKYYLAILEWINDIITKIPNQKCIAMIFACYINADMTIVQFAKYFNDDANELRRRLTEELKKSIDEHNISLGNELFVKGKI